jgi:phosphoenolpyruvate---glycerone phosphotransferase subunit DhaK
VSRTSPASVPALRGDDARTAKFVNDPRHAVDDMLDGFLRTHAALVRRSGSPRVVVSARPRSRGVRVISGGGSGHEPALLGYVGAGLLDAVVVGEVFASPPAPSVAEAIRAVDTGQGVLIVIGNYAGDVMNFEMAAEWAREEGHDVTIELVTDDVAGETGDIRSRRGLAGGVFAWKAAGATAANGWSLGEVREAAAAAIGNTRTVAVATSPASIPGSAHAAFAASPVTYQFGVGHGEPGIRVEPMAPVDAVVDGMLEPLLAGGFLPAPGRKAVTMVNGLGAASMLELYIAQRRLLDVLDARGVAVRRSFVGPFYTALDTAGFSITVLAADDALAELIDAPACAPHFRMPVEVAE